MNQKMLTPEEIWESIRLEKLLDAEVEKIIQTYNIKTHAGIKAAVRQGLWAGMCHGKGWD